jgi:hypothetical protein
MERNLDTISVTKGKSETLAMINRNIKLCIGKVMLERQ